MKLTRKKIYKLLKILNKIKTKKKRTRRIDKLKSKMNKKMSKKIKKRKNQNTRKKNTKFRTNRRDKMLKKVMTGGNTDSIDEHTNTNDKSNVYQFDAGKDSKVLISLSLDKKGNPVNGGINVYTDTNLRTPDWIKRLDDIYNDKPKSGLDVEDYGPDEAERDPDAEANAEANTEAEGNPGDEANAEANAEAEGNPGADANAEANAETERAASGSATPAASAASGADASSERGLSARGGREGDFNNPIRANNDDEEHKSDDPEDIEGKLDDSDDVDRFQRIGVSNEAPFG